MLIPNSVFHHHDLIWNLYLYIWGFRKPQKTTHLLQKRHTIRNRGHLGYLFSVMQCTKKKTRTDLDGGNGSEEVELSVVFFAAGTGKSLLASGRASRASRSIRPGDRRILRIIISTIGGWMVAVNRNQPESLIQDYSKSSEVVGLPD